jgi:hypothetical protein
MLPIFNYTNIPQASIIAKHIFNDLFWYVSDKDLEGVTNLQFDILHLQKK